MAEKQNFSKSTMMITIIVAVVLCALIWPLSLKGKGSAPVSNTDDADMRIQPVAKVELQKAVVKSDGKPRDGAAVYAAVCMACHSTGVAGAPKAGDKAAWAPRIATGTAAMIKSVAGGKGAMPPKGGGADLTDAEIKAAVVHLTGLSK
jgi:cytochrome c5